MQHTQVVVSPIENDCLKLSIDGQAQPQLVPKWLHNRMVINEAIYEDNNLIISDSTLRNILPTQLNNITFQY